MTSCDDFIQFDQSEDWDRVIGATFTATNIGENSFTPIGQVDLRVALTEPYVVIVVQPIDPKPTWRYGGEIRQVWDFPKGGEIGAAFAGAQSKPTQLFINKPQVIDLSRNGTGRFRLRYDPPTWFRGVVVIGWVYVGEVENFTKDTLFDIGNAIGIGTLNESDSIPNLIANLQSESEAIRARLDDLFDVVNDGNNDSAITNDQIQQSNENVIQNVQQISQQINDLSNDLANVLAGNSDPNSLSQNNNPTSIEDEFI